VRTFNFVAGIGTVVYGLDLMANIVTFGFKVFRLRKVLILELLIQAFLWISIIVRTWFFDDAWISARALLILLFSFIIRNIRFLELLLEMHFFSSSFNTIERLTVPILGKLLFLYMLFFVYASIG